MRALLPVTSASVVDAAELLAGVDGAEDLLFFLSLPNIDPANPKDATFNRVFLDIMLYVSYLKISGCRY